MARGIAKTGGSMRVGRAWGILALLVTTLAAPGVMAQPQVDAARRTAARALAEEGDQFWDLGNYREALDRFVRAGSLVEAPTLTFRQAECLEKMGRWVEAADRFATVARMTVAPDDPDAFREAIAEAQRRMEVLQAKLPKLQITVSGSYARSAQLLMDGREVPSELWGVPFPVDPGTHKLDLVRPDVSATKTVTLAQNETQRVDLAFDLHRAPDTGTAALEPAPAATPPNLAKPSPSEPTDRPGSTQRLLGWTSVAVGGVGLTVGTIAGIVVLTRKGEYSDTCASDTCPASMGGLVDDYNRTRNISTVGFAVGLVGVGVGTYLLLTAPDAKPSPGHAVGVRPWVGVGSAGVSGIF
jgi:hypothetical protein